MKRPDPAPEQFAEDNPCLCFHLRKAARVVTQLYDEQFRKTGYRVTQMTILMAVEKLSPVNVQQLAKAVVTDRTTLSRNLKPLLRDGMIQFCSCDDQRQRQVAITPRGKALIQQADPIWKKVQKTLHEKIGQQCIEDVISTLSEMERRIKD
jgi:DNA-binding MarR family transcriptional regulator